MERISLADAQEDLQLFLYRKHRDAQPCYRFPGYSEVDLYDAIHSSADLTRELLGIEDSSTPSRFSSDSPAVINKSKIKPSTQTKSLLIKIQLPFAGHNIKPGDVPPSDYDMDGPMLVYSKRRDFLCLINREDRPDEYDRIREVVKSKGVGSVKAYFAAELRGWDELVVKVDEVLAEQPF